MIKRMPQNQSGVGRFVLNPVFCQEEEGEEEQVRTSEAVKDKKNFSAKEKVILRKTINS